MIRATQYLPSILKLQQYLLSFHHHHSMHVQLKDKKIVHVIREAENGIHFSTSYTAIYQW